MLERDGVLEVAQQLLARSCSGFGSTLFVRGEAGLGKTTLLEEVCSAAPSSMRVLQARGDVMESSLPFAFLAQVVDDLAAPGPLDSVGTGTGLSDARSQAFHRSLRWLEDQSSTSGPILLALDDLHWSDADSLALLSFLARRTGNLAVAVIATLRPWPSAGQDVCRSLVDSGHASWERLEPLSEEGAKALLAQRVGRPLNPSTAQKAAVLCGGNPLLLGLVSNELVRGERLPDLGGRRLLTGEMLLPRFAGLDTVGLDCAKAASVLGDRFRADLAAEVARLSDKDADSAVEALCRSGLVRALDGPWAEFSHPLFRQALYEDLPGPLRCRLHSRAFSALVRRGMVAEAAEHAVRADLRGDPTAISVLAAAGRSALQSGAAATAALRLGAAVELSGDDADAQMMIGLCQALVASASSEAVAMCERVLRGDLAPADRIVALKIAAQALSVVGSHEESDARFEESVALGERHDPAAAADALVDHALTTWFTFGPRRSLPLVLRARELARHCAGSAGMRAESAWAFVALQAGDPSGVKLLADVARPLIDDPYSDMADLYSHWSRLALYGNACSMLERFDEGDRAFRALAAAAEPIGALATMAGLWCNHAYLLLRAGRLDESLACLEQCIGLADVAPFIEPFGAVGLATVLHLMGRFEESLSWRRRAEQTAPPSEVGGNVEFFLHDLAGQSHRRLGSPKESSDSYLALEAVIERMGIREPCLPAWGRHALVAHVSCGRLRDARRVLDWLKDCSAHLPCHFPRIALLTGQAMLAEQSGDNSLAETCHRMALGLHQEVDLPLEKIETLLELGSFLRRSGRPAVARPFLSEAAETGERIGALWLAQLAARELHVAGGRRRSPRRHPSDLTPQESRVAELASRGSSNRDIARQLFVSEATVESHLQRIYAKLGIHSRRELIVAGQRHRPGEDGKLSRDPRMLA